MLIRALILLCLCAASLVQGASATLVKVASVTVLDTAPRTWTPGTVLSHTDAQLGTEVAGLITWIADPGTHLEQGDVVARVNDELLNMALQESEAQVRGLEQRLVFLTSEAKRLTSLALVNSAAQSQLEERVANRDVAIEGLSEARAKESMNRYRLAKTRILAPFAGQIVERLVNLGEYMTVGQPVVRMVDLENLEIRCQAPLRVAPFVRKGMPLRVRHEAGEIEVGVSAVIPVGDLDSRTFEIRLKLEQNDWVIGTPVQLGLPTSSSKRILTVPRDALVLRESGPAVFAVTDNVVRRVDVKTGIGADARIEVLGTDLVAGDQVVVGGAEMLRDGQQVSFN